MWATGQFCCLSAVLLLYSMKRISMSHFVDKITRRLNENLSLARGRFKNRRQLHFETSETLVYCDHSLSMKVKCKSWPRRFPTVVSNIDDSLPWRYLTKSSHQLVERLRRTSSIAIIPYLEKSNVEVDPEHYSRCEQHRWDLLWRCFIKSGHQRFKKKSPHLLGLRRQFSLNITNFLIWKLVSSTNHPKEVQGSLSKWAMMIFPPIFAHFTDGQDAPDHPRRRAVVVVEHEWWLEKLVLSYEPEIKSNAIILLGGRLEGHRDLSPRNARNARQRKTFAQTTTEKNWRTSRTFYKDNAATALAKRLKDINSGAFFEHTTLGYERFMVCSPDQMLQESGIPEILELKLRTLGKPHRWVP